MNPLHTVMKGAEPVFLKGERSDQAILCIHGFTGSPYEFREYANQFHSRGYTVSVPLLAGHGTSPADLEQTTWIDWWESVKSAYRALRKEYEIIHVIGLSMGGTLGLHLASHYEVGKLMVLASPVFLNDPKLKWVPFAKYFLRFRKKENGPDILDENARESAVHYELQPLKSIHQLLKLLEHVRNDLPEVRCPTLLIYALEDQVVPFENQNFIFRQIASVKKEKVILKKSHHILPLDIEKETVFNHLMTFLRE